MKVKFFTLGCKVNQCESEAMLGALIEHGFTQAAKGETVDVVVVNSCTVTAESDRKVRQLLRRAKKDSPGAVAVLTGCMVQAFPQESEALEEADILLGTVNRAHLLPDLLRFFETRERVVDIAPHVSGEAFEPLTVQSFSEHTRAFVKIEDGCNRFCAYCIIPYARGRVRSKPLADIRREVETLAANGYREIVLTGINLSAYGAEFGLHLCDAVETVCAVAGVARVRLGSLEPEALSPEVIGRMAAQNKLCPQFHLSLQSGSDATLRRMNRHYTSAEYREIVENLRAAFQNAAITTDIMVGFAGETEAEFEESLRFAKEIGFARTHVFAYSRRPGTRAYDMPGQLSNAEKERRSRRMIELSAASQRAFFGAQIGRTEKVLFEEELSPGVFTGYTANYTPIRVESAETLSGTIRNVRITSAETEGCVGTLLSRSDTETHSV